MKDTKPTPRPTNEQDNPKPRRIVAKPGVKIEPEAIGQAVAEERESVSRPKRQRLTAQQIEADFKRLSADDPKLDVQAVLKDLRG